MELKGNAKQNSTLFFFFYSQSTDDHCSTALLDRVVQAQDRPLQQGAAALQEVVVGQVQEKRFRSPVRQPNR